MNVLKIALEEGFSGQHVVVSVDGTVVLDETDVRTRLQIGLARSVEVQVPDGGHSVEVRVEGEPPLRTEVDAPVTQSVRISLTAEGSPVAVASRDRPRYL
ncbi:hypothetical protein [Streptomyces sp. NPDC059008]|uniref:hypothetical protein n=1 Tax=unclassified Streptomyces TaxID=2593676 RepID=UPI00367639D0